MKPETIAALDRVNRDFYLSQAKEFSVTRQKPWPAWERVVDRFLGLQAGSHAPHSILDVGCGNGRFAALLEARPGAVWSYSGIDSSLHLAAIASDGESGDRSFVAADVVNEALPLIGRSRRFDLIVAFGLLHHIPSWERRRSLLVELAGHLSANGMLAVSFWQFGAEPRFTRRFVDWREYGRAASGSIDVEDLEAGDHLLAWGDVGAVRYCHFAGPAEAAELTAASGLRRIETFHGDGRSGRLNLYHLLVRRSSDSP